MGKVTKRVHGMGPVYTVRWVYITLCVWICMCMMGKVMKMVHGMQGDEDGAWHGTCVHYAVGIHVCVCI